MQLYNSIYYRNYINNFVKYAESYGASGTTAFKPLPNPNRAYIAKPEMAAPVQQQQPIVNNAPVDPILTKQINNFGMNFNSTSSRLARNPDLNAADKAYMEDMANHTAGVIRASGVPLDRAMYAAGRNGSDFEKAVQNAYSNGSDANAQPLNHGVVSAPVPPQKQLFRPRPHR